MNVKKYLRCAVTAITASAIMLTSTPPPAHAADAIEPGSPESFLQWAVATGDYIAGLGVSLSTPGGAGIGWTKESLKYALEMRSLMIAYQTWYDNQDYNGSTVAFQTFGGYLYCGDDRDDTRPRGYRYVMATACTTRNYDYLPPAQFGWVDLPWGGVRSNPESMAPYVSSNSYTYAEVNCGTNFNNCLGLQDYQAKALQIYFYKEGNPSGMFSVGQWNSISCYPNAPDMPLNNLSFVPSDFPAQTFGPDDSLPDKVKDIQQKYPPDVVDEFPDIEDPVSDPDLEEHPDGCNCVCHVEVNVTVEFPTDWQPQWPTYDVTDVPEPSDFDFNQLETLDPSETDQISFDMEELPDDALTGAGFWFNLMDDWADLFQVKGLVITMLSISLLLFFIVR